MPKCGFIYSIINFSCHVADGLSRQTRRIDKSVKVLGGVADTSRVTNLEIM
jgi:hypothetical protein